MRWIRSWIYKHGYRPNLGSIFYSPSLALVYAFKDGDVMSKVAAEIELRKKEK